jgi:peptidoglycan-N-acetylglucosamine deacetylase
VAPGSSAIAVRWRLDATGGVALTFDDGDDPVAWRRILDELRRLRVPAAFFALGMRVEQFAGEARRTVAEGHVVGAHGWDPADLTELPAHDVVSRLAADRAAWRAAGAADVALFRPPFGRHTPETLRAAASAGYTSAVLWDVDPRDWQFPDPEIITARVLDGCTAGSIVDLHVTRPTAAALGDVVHGLRRRGLPCCALPCR